jgi:hypothetical protein
MSMITESTFRLDPRTGRFHDRDGVPMEVHPAGLVDGLREQVVRLQAERDLARAMAAMHADRLEGQIAERTLERDEARGACRLVLDGLREDLGGVCSIRLRGEDMERLRAAARFRE